METAQLEGKSVLIVDDDPDIVVALSAAFEETGAIVTTAQDGNEATERAETESPDLIILDAMLPKRSGFLVLERLKSRKPRGGKPYVIMITGNAGKRHQAWAESLGVDAYINKPFRMEKLMQSAEDLLGRPEG
ncbi:MAG: response regulator [Planctomycetes bacterium]|nr:response regulator [Planctomycetota bacterium]